jgi:hypothetical protein
MEYNLTDKQRAVITWMVEANRRGELADEFSVFWVMELDRAEIMNPDGTPVADEMPAITPGTLDRLHAEGLIQQDIRYETKIKQSSTQRNPRVTETQSERSRSCSLTRRAYEAVDANFVVPEPQPTAASFHFYGDVSQSIVGTQNRAELTNNMDFGSVREQIDREGGDDREELHLALDHVERLVERGEYLDRGALSRFSGLMERHSWFTNAVMGALLGFATQVVT